MIQIKTDEEIELMRKSAKLAAEVLLMIEPYVKPGITTNRLDELCHDFIVSHGAIPSPLNYRGFPKSICSSINEEICHGIPSDRKLRNGDVVNLDITTYLNGFHGDTSRMFYVGSARRYQRWPYCPASVDVSAGAIINQLKQRKDIHTAAPNFC